MEYMYCIRLRIQNRINPGHSVIKIKLNDFDDRPIVYLTSNVDPKMDSKDVFDVLDPLELLKIENKNNKRNNKTTHALNDFQPKH